MTAHEDHHCRPHLSRRTFRFPDLRQCAVELGLTVLHNLRFQMSPSDSLVWGDAADANNALEEIRKEQARLARTAAS